MGIVLDGNELFSLNGERDQLMNESKITERLRYNILFENFDAPLFERVRSSLRERRYPAGSIIRSEQNTDTSLLLIADGRIRVHRRSPNGEELMLALLHHGDFVGELELIDGRPRTSVASALDDCILYELPQTEFDSLLHENHAFSVRLLQVLSVRLRASNHHFAGELVRHNEHERRELNKLKRLIEAARTINSTLNVDELLQLIVDTSINVLDAEGGTLYLTDEARSEIWSKVLKGFLLVEIRMPLGKGIAGYVASTGETVRIANAYLDPRFNPEIDAQTGFRTRSMLCSPIRNKNGKIVGVLQLLNKREGEFTDDDISFLNALSIHSALALENARMFEVERQKQALENQLYAARSVQRSLLPQAPPVVPGYELAGKTISAEVVGGDYFDFITVDEKRTVVCLGDVTGKGLPAALLMANVQAILRSQMMIKASPRKTMFRANKLLHQSTADDKFVTMFYAMLDHQKHVLGYTNAGHEHPFLLRNNGTFERLTTGGLILGIFPEATYEEEEVSLEPGETLVIFSDGVSESVNPQNEQFGKIKMGEYLVANRNRSSQEILDGLVQVVQEHTRGKAQFDDITIVILKRL